VVSILPPINRTVRGRSGRARRRGCRPVRWLWRDAICRYRCHRSARRCAVQRESRRSPGRGPAPRLLGGAGEVELGNIRNILGQRQLTKPSAGCHSGRNRRSVLAATAARRGQDRRRWLGGSPAGQNVEDNVSGMDAATPPPSASAQAASTAARPSVSTAERILTISDGRHGPSPSA
jgi:hypothetical protein